MSSGGSTGVQLVRTPKSLKLLFIMLEVEAHGQTLRPTLTADIVGRQRRPSMSAVFLLQSIWRAVTVVRQPT